VRWRQALRFRRAGSTAPADAIERVARHANFHLHLAAPWHEAVVDDNRVRARAEDGTFEFDFVIAARATRSICMRGPNSPASPIMCCLGATATRPHPTNATMRSNMWRSGPARHRS